MDPPPSTREWERPLRPCLPARLAAQPAPPAPLPQGLGHTRAGSATAYLMVHDLPVGLHKGFGVERGLSVQHLVHADAQRPPVTLGAVLAHAILHRLQDLWGDVVRGAHSHGRLHLREEGGQGEGKPEDVSSRQWMKK